MANKTHTKPLIHHHNEWNEMSTNYMLCNIKLQWSFWLFSSIPSDGISVPQAWILSERMWAQSCLCFLSQWTPNARVLPSSIWPPESPLPASVSNHTTRGPLSLLLASSNTPEILHFCCWPPCRIPELVCPCQGPLGPELSHIASWLGQPRQFFVLFFFFNSVAPCFWFFLGCFPFYFDSLCLVCLVFSFTFPSLVSPIVSTCVFQLLLTFLLFVFCMSACEFFLLLYGHCLLPFVELHLY